MLGAKLFFRLGGADAEVGCVQKNWFEHRHRLFLFAAAPPEAESVPQTDDTAAVGPQHRLRKVDGVFRIKNPQDVDAPLSV